MRLFVALLFVLAFLDAMSTYIIVAGGLGVEANPAVADVINSNPAAVFPLALISAAVPAVAMYVATELSRRLSARLRATAMRLITSALVVMATWRVVIITNNVFVIAAGTAPLAEVLLSSSN
jgi:hypothetical protein